MSFPFRRGIPTSRLTRLGSGPSETETQEVEASGIMKTPRHDDQRISHGAERRGREYP